MNVFKKKTVLNLNCSDLALLLDEDDPQRCRWLGRAAKLGKHHKFWAEATEQMKKNKPNVLFALGRALKNNVDVDRQVYLFVWFGLVFFFKFFLKRKCLVVQIQVLFVISRLQRQ
jgi:hypothetical protein